MLVNGEELASRMSEGYGVIRAPLARVIASLESNLLICHMGAFRFVEVNGCAAKSMDFLRVLTQPQTRYVFFTSAEDQTFFIGNGIGGSDPMDVYRCVARVLAVPVARVIDSPSRVLECDGISEVLSYESRVFEVSDERGDVVKSIACSNDGGKWSWWSHGELSDAERSFPYNARLIRRRLSSDHLGSLVGAFGFSVLSSSVLLSSSVSYTAEFRLCRSKTHDRVCRESCTPEERDDPAYSYYRRGMAWMKHVGSHYDSAIADFERCIRLNPSFEPRVRSALERAWSAKASGGDQGNRTR